VDWRYKFQLKDLLSDKDTPPAEVQVVAQTLVSRLKAHRVFGEHQLDLEAAFEDIQDQDDFNNVLDALYDAADKLRVWVQ